MKHGKFIWAALLMFVCLSLFSTAQVREDWVVGTTHNITWNSTGTITAIKIEYTYDSGATWHLIAENVPNTGSYPWVVPNTPSTHCKMRITITGTPDPQFIGLADESDNEWTISAAPSITIIKPNGGEILIAGSIMPIIWESVGVVGPVKIEYSTNNGITYNTVAKAVPNTGLYMWTVPKFPGNLYRIRISQAYGNINI